MANDWYRRHRFLFALLHAGPVLLLWAVAGHAAVLKDIRIGRYDDFTRIVFEFDVQTALDAIERIGPGRYKLSFAQTQARFARPIPKKDSDDLKDFEVWQYQDRLSVILNFQRNHLRFDDFQFQNPPRLILDVFDVPLPADKTSVVLETDLSASNPQPVQTRAPIANELNLKQSPLPLDRLTLSKNQTMPDSAEPAQMPATQKGLQYYLLVALVILTIVILTLLVIMLFSRRRWITSRRTLSIEDVLHRQDEHIASINSQIEEHLKRFTEV